MGRDIMLATVFILCATIVGIFGDAYIPSSPVVYGSPSHKVVDHHPVVYDSAYDDYGKFDQYDDSAVVEVLGDDEVLVEQYHGLGEGPDGEMGTYASSGLYQQFIGEPTRLMYRRLAPRHRQHGGRVVYREHTEAPLVRVQAVREHVPARVVTRSRHPAVRRHHGAGHREFEVVRRVSGAHGAGRHGMHGGSGY